VFSFAVGLVLLEAFGDLWFVVKIIAFSYLLFQLYMMFRENQVLFGLAVIVAAYFFFIHAVSVVFLLLAFFLFVVFGNQVQMLVQFGLEPILGAFGIGGHKHQFEQSEAMRLEEKMSEGQPLNQAEQDFMEGWTAKQMKAQQNTGMMQEQLMRRRMM